MFEKGVCRMKISILLFIFLFHISVYGQVLTGLDVMENGGFAELKNKKVAVLTNGTAVNKDGALILDLLKKQKVNVRMVFSPEHGFKIDKDEAVEDGKIGETPLISLYGNRRKPDPALLKDIDVVIYDIQDAGARYYTYISTLAYMMEAVKKAKKEMIVLDRPVIVGGEPVSGFVPPKNLTGFFTSIYPIATRYGMTVGEIATLFNDHFGIKAEMTVIKMKNYSRKMLFNETGLPWISPSPNLTSVDTALLYSELGWLETVNLSMGRGTDTPFQLIGAPFIDEKKLFEELKKQKFAGLSIEPVRFTPKAKVHKYFGKECGGIKISVTDKKNNQGFKLGVELLKNLLDLYPEQIHISKDFALMTGSRELENLIRKNTPFEQIEKKAQISRKEFEQIRKKYLIYK
jgi:uncharacterized protein YbbC (DUF1343 family)